MSSYNMLSPHHCVLCMLHPVTASIFHLALLVDFFLAYIWFSLVSPPACTSACSSVIFTSPYTSLKESGRRWVSLFGSSLISQLGFRDNFIMIGHRGLAAGSAIEYVSSLIIHNIIYPLLNVSVFAR